jgi:hypothetical protein
MDYLNDLLGLDSDEVEAAAARGAALDEAMHAAIGTRTGMRRPEGLVGSDPTTRYNTLYLATRGVLAMAPTLDPDIVVEALCTAGGMWQTGRPLPRLIEDRA